jgi:hypothetical protein
MGRNYIEAGEEISEELGRLEEDARIARSYLMDDIFGCDERELEEAHENEYVLVWREF